MNSLRLVRDYFDRAARRFDRIYEADKPLSQKVVDRLFRRVVLERFDLICALAPLRGEFTVLDVGCGPGRYAVALAKAGGRVVGIDVSAPMIELARTDAARSGVSERCSFEVASFLDYRGTERADVVVATGYFDYLEEPLAHLRKMADLCRGRIFATFPKRWEVRAPIRKLRFSLAGGFVRFYGKGEVRALFAEAKLDSVALVDLGRDYVAIARVP
jgi:2-polyprenyl-3-methyl-5-hydroxy-6-metoxy-1,4-benzoquinol methylase